MTQHTEIPAAGSPEFFSARQVASELMIRALFHMHPNKALVNTYLERMLGLTLVQPHYLQNLGQAALVKQTIAGVVADGPPETPDAL